MRFRKKKVVDVDRHGNAVKYGIKMNVKLAIIIAVAVIILWFFRPWFHDFVMAFYTTPMLLLFFASFGLIGWSIMKRKFRWTGAFVLLAIICFMMLSFNQVILQNYIVGEQSYSKINSLPESTQIRLLPRSVAARYLDDSLQKSTEKLGGLDIVNYDDNLIWTAPRVPDGEILYLTKKVNGIMTADATQTKRETNLITQEMPIGEDIGVTDNIYWKLYKKEYFMHVGDIFYLNEGDKVITVAPLIRYRFKFPVMVPYFAGAFVIDGKQVTRMSPEEIAKDPLFEGNMAFPEGLARLYVDSYKYYKGVINTWFFHEDQIEISDVYGQGNRQPFLMSTQEGLKWIIATEPYGESYGVFKIFMVDAITGDIKLYELDEAKTLTGPVRVVSYVKKQFPTIDWANSRVIEPRPYVIDGKLYWMLSITPADFAGVSYTVLVDSENNDVLVFESDQEIISFVKTGEVDAPSDINVTEDSDVQDKIAQIERLLEEIKQELE